MADTKKTLNEINEAIDEVIGFYDRLAKHCSETGNSEGALYNYGKVSALKEAQSIIWEF